MNKKAQFGNLFPSRRQMEKERKKQRLRQSVEQGKMGEANVRMKYALRGYDVERTGRGEDFTVRKRDLLTGRVKETKHIEVKTGQAKLSKLQQKTKKKKSNYVVERVRGWF